MTRPLGTTKRACVEPWRRTVVTVQDQIEYSNCPHASRHIDNVWVTANQDFRGTSCIAAPPPVRSRRTPPAVHVTVIARP